MSEEYKILVPGFNLGNIPTEFSYIGGAKETLNPCDPEQAKYYCTTEDLNNISITLNSILDVFKTKSSVTNLVYNTDYIDQNFYKKSEIDKNFLSASISANYYTISQVDKWFYTKAAIDTKFNDYALSATIWDTFYKKTEIDNNYFTKNYILSNYWTSGEVHEEIVNAYRVPSAIIEPDSYTIKFLNKSEVNVLDPKLTPDKAIGVRLFEGAGAGTFNKSDSSSYLGQKTVIRRTTAGLHVPYISSSLEVDQTVPGGLYVRTNPDTIELNNGLNVKHDGITIQTDDTTGLYIPRDANTLAVTTTAANGTNAPNVDRTINEMRVNIDNKVLHAPNPSAGIGLSIDNDYIVVGDDIKCPFVHTNPVNVKDGYKTGLTLGPKYKEKLNESPVYISQAAGNVLFLIGTESKIMNFVRAYETSDNTDLLPVIKSAKWVFPMTSYQSQLRKGKK
jgi:hypothetical protein